MHGWFQLAYVTRDIERAKTDLTRRLGVDAFIELPEDIEVQEHGQPGLVRAHACLAPSGGPFVIELLEPLEGGTSDLLTSMLDNNGRWDTRLHHVGVRVPSRDALHSQLRASGNDFYSTGEVPGQVRAGFIDLRSELGHFVEALEFSDEAWAMVDGLICTTVGMPGDRESDRH